MPHPLPVGQLSILAGASGAGKTTLMLQAIKAWREGDTDFPLQFTASSCLYIVADRAEDEVKQRAKYLGLREDSGFSIQSILHKIDGNDALIMDERKMQKLVLERTRSAEDLVILDPIGLFISEQTISYKHIAASLIPMGRFAERTKITIIATHHAAKRRTDYGYRRPQDRILGSAAFQGYSGTQMILEQGVENEMEADTFSIIHHVHAPEVYTLYRRPDGYFTTSLHAAEVVVNQFIQEMEDGREYRAKELVRLAVVKHKMSRAALYRMLNFNIELGVLSSPRRGVFVKRTQ